MLWEQLLGFLFVNAVLKPLIDDNMMGRWEGDDESKWCKASGLLLKAMQVSTMFKKASNEEQKQINEYLLILWSSECPPSI